MDHRALAVSVIDISSDIRRKSLNDTGVRPLSNGVLEILRVIESHPAITVAEVASRLGRQFSNVSVQLRELAGLYGQDGDGWAARPGGPAQCCGTGSRLDLTRPQPAPLCGCGPGRFPSWSRPGAR